MSDHPAKTLKNEIWINADPAVVFNAISNGDEIVNWFPDAEAAISSTVGGEVVFKWKDGGILKSTIQKYESNKLISYGFYGGDDEPVTFIVNKDGNGTRLFLEHLIPPGSPMGHVDGLIEIATSWTYLLTGLKCWVEHQLDIRDLVGPNFAANEGK